MGLDRPIGLCRLFRVQTRPAHAGGPLACVDKAGTYRIEGFRKGRRVQGPHWPVKERPARTGMRVLDKRGACMGPIGLCRLTQAWQVQGPPRAAPPTVYSLLI